MSLPTSYHGDDFYCDLSLPNVGARDVIHDDDRVLERDHGAARVVTNLGSYQDSRHLHVHVLSGSVR
ncbi:MAG TPA: hypothetical protein VH228_05910 [Nocardioides sp.]|nr:hypothetical protein [Nocardioides sp.]